MSRRLVHSVPEDPGRWLVLRDAKAAKWFSWRDTGHLASDVECAVGKDGRRRVFKSEAAAIEVADGFNTGIRTPGLRRKLSALKRESFLFAPNEKPPIWAKHLVAKGVARFIPWLIDECTQGVEAI